MTDDNIEHYAEVMARAQVRITQKFEDYGKVDPRFCGLCASNGYRMVQMAVFEELIESSDDPEERGHLAAQMAALSGPPMPLHAATIAERQSLQ